MKFHEILKMLREQKGVTQDELAKVLNISPASVSHYEIGNRQPSLDIIIQIARYFDVSMDYLTGITSYNVPISKLTHNYTKNITVDKLINRLDSFDTAHRTLLVSLIDCVEARMLLSSKRK